MGGLSGQRCVIGNGMSEGEGEGKGVELSGLFLIV